MKFDKNTLIGAVLGVVLTLAAGVIGTDAVKNACQAVIGIEAPAAKTPGP
jgi:hypothetical protein